jgi:hypothetical protein
MYACSTASTRHVVWLASCCSGAKSPALKLARVICLNLSTTLLLVCGYVHRVIKDLADHSLL